MFIEIAAISLIRVSQVDKYNQKDNKGLSKILQMFKDENITLTQIMADRHTQIRKYMSKKESGINHHFDSWHFAKNIKKKLINESQKTSCKILSKWVKSIGNTFWWVCATSEGDFELLQEKWISILFHIQGKHELAGHNMLKKKCAQQKLRKKQIKAKEWISPMSDAFEALQSIVICKNTFKSLLHFNQFCHTEVLEI